MSAGRTLAALVETARRSTGSVAALLLTRGGDDDMAVAAAAGSSGPAPSTIDPDTTYAGMVLTSEQPMALRVRPGDPRVASETALLGREPGAVCAVPCVGPDDVNGVLVLIDKADGGAFDFDDVEVASMLAEIAGAALEDQGTAAVPPSPDELANHLRDLAQRDPGRYRQVAALVTVVLGSG